MSKVFSGPQGSGDVTYGFSSQNKMNQQEPMRVLLTQRKSTTFAQQKNNIRKHINELLMYNEKIVTLISAALADGTLTGKDILVLMKRAEAQGIDLDEFKMVLSARLFELV